MASAILIPFAPVDFDSKVRFVSHALRLVSAVSLLVSHCAYNSELYVSATRLCEELAQAVVGIIESTGSAPTVVSVLHSSGICKDVWDHGLTAMVGRTIACAAAAAHARRLQVRAKKSKTNATVSAVMSSGYNSVAKTNSASVDKKLCLSDPYVDIGAEKFIPLSFWAELACSIKKKSYVEISREREVFSLALILQKIIPDPELNCVFVKSVLNNDESWSLLSVDPSAATSCSSKFQFLSSSGSESGSCSNGLHALSQLQSAVLESADDAYLCRVFQSFAQHQFSTYVNGRNVAHTLHRWSPNLLSETSIGLSAGPTHVMGDRRSIPNPPLEFLLAHNTYGLPKLSFFFDPVSAMGQSVALQALRGKKKCSIIMCYVWLVYIYLI